MDNFTFTLSELNSSRFFVTRGKRNVRKYGPFQGSHMPSSQEENGTLLISKKATLLIALQGEMRGDNPFFEGPSRRVLSQKAATILSLERTLFFHSLQDVDKKLPCALFNIRNVEECLQ
jgi:hypothetical protein